MCLRRGAARYIWFVFQPDENKGYYEDVWVFWEGETGNQLLNSQRVSRSRVQEEGWGHKNFCLFFSSRTWELRLAKLSWNQFFTDFVECKSNDRTGAANREQHLCSQGDRQVPGNIRAVLASPPPIFRMVGEMSHVKLAVALLFMPPPIIRTDMSILRPKLYPKIFFFSFFSRSFVRNSH